MSLNFGITEAKMEALRRRMEQCGLSESDLEEAFVRASGPGGQNVNKTATAVRLVHRPSGLEVKMQTQRTQGLNRYYARKRLCERLEQQTLGKQSPAALKQEKIRKQKQRRRRRSASSDGSSGS